MWNLDATKSFNVKTLRGLVEESRGEGKGNVVETRWHKMIPRKVCIFIWRARLGRIPSRSVLERMGIDFDSVLCPRCGEMPETVNHALVGC